MTLYEIKGTRMQKGIDDNGILTDMVVIVFTFPPNHTGEITVPQNVYQSGGARDLIVKHIEVTRQYERGE